MLTWNRMYNVLLSLARKILRSGFVPDVIVGVSRGGWIPARVLCDLLSAPVLANIGVEFYTGIGKTGRRPRLTQPLSTSVSGKKVLLVDEVTDTGESLKLAKEQVIKEGANKVKTATVYTKPWSIIEPDYQGKKTSCWIVFPWETKETIQSVTRGSKWKQRKELDDIQHGRLSARQAQRFLNKILAEKHKIRRSGPD
ncbi:MAG: phosphoribosyltransferase [Candidatus Bathyarchaeia archaeon]